MRWKRAVLSLLCSLVLFAADVYLYSALEEFYRPGRPPAWMSYATAGLIMWPFYVFRIPMVASPAQDLPIVLTLIASCVIDILLVTLAIYALLSRRANRRARA